VFAISGCAGLVHEVAWARALGQSLGNSLQALTAVLAAFLGGLGLGSAIAARAAGRSRDPLRVYALLEGLLALCGPLGPALAWTLPRILQAAGPACASDASLAALRFGLSVLVLAPPTVLMGATLPYLVREASIRGGAPGGALAALYGANTLGAAAGALLGSFALLPLLGTRNTFLTAGLLNTVAAVAAVVLRARRGAAAPMGGADRAVGPATDAVPPRGRLGALTTAAALSGAVGAFLQVGWTRVAALSFGSSVYALGITLAAYISGLGVGPLLVRRRLARGGSTLLAAAALGGAGLSSLLLVPLLGRLPIVAAMASGWIEVSPAALFVLQFAVVGTLLLVPTVAQGMVFPALAAVATDSPVVAHRFAGRLYAASAWGSVSGFVLAGFLALPSLGARRSLVAASAASMLVALLPLHLPPRRRAVNGVTGACLVCASLALPWILPGWDLDLMSSGGFLYGPIYRSASGAGGQVRQWIHRRGEILFSREDGAGLVTVRRSPAGVQSLQINGKTEASTRGDMSTQLLSAHLPLLLHPDPREVLVIGLASGITLGAAERHALGSIEVIEIAPAVREAARLFDPWSGRALADPRVRVVIDDARGRLIVRRRRFDVITSQPSNPWVAGVSNLFTVEFYRLARARLNPGGLFCQWVQAYRLSPGDFRGIVGSFLQVFPEATLWEESAGGGDYFLVGGDAPLRPSLARLEGNGRRPAWDHLKEAGVDGPADLLSRFVSGPEGLRTLAQGARLHTDDDLYLEARAPLTMFRDSLREQLTALRRVRQPVLAILPEGIAASDPTLVRALRERERRRDLRLEIAVGLKDADLWGLGDPYLAAGIDALRAGLLADAVATLSRAAARNPQSGTAHYLLGEAYRASGLEKAATVAYSEAVRRNPELAPAWNALGRAFAARGEADRAAAFEKALLIDPGLAAARNNVGALRLQAGDAPEAERQFLRALEDDPDLAAAQANLGLLFKRRGDRVAAEARYRAALERDPLNTDALYNLAALLREEGRIADARLELGHLLAIDPGDTEATRLQRDIESDFRSGTGPRRPR
jgi:spermidine synthase